MADHINGVNGHSASAHCTIDEFLAQQYDFIIVGGGTAGLAVAARLTENPDVNVGVLEAGKNRLNDMLVDTPGLFVQMLGNKDYDWIYRTTPQKGNNGIVHHMPRGKLLGGSSGINYMMYVRGSDADYDDWATLVEDDSWSAKHMKQYMRKHQTLEPIDASVVDRNATPFIGENHGTSGPVKTSFNDTSIPIEDGVIRAANEATGINKKPMDPWSGDHIGFYNTLGTVGRTGPNRGKRSYAARGYFEANQYRPNLKVLCEAFCTRLVIEDLSAKGVQFIHNGASYTIGTKREVVVCLGTVASPQILELSGIGDPEVLKAAGVECKVELPGVGNNFQDHIGVITSHKLTSGNVSLDAVHKPEVMADMQQQFMENQGGPLTGISSVQGFFPYTLFADNAQLESTVKSIEKTPNTTSFQKRQLVQVSRHVADSQSANLQLVLIAATPDFAEGLQDQAKLFRPGDPDNCAITLACSVQYPASRGSVHIKNNDPKEQPAIDPAYLTHEADVKVLAGGMRMLDKMASCEGLSGKLASRITPNPEVDLQDPLQAEQAVRDWVMGAYHPVGTCAMGDVVDSRLKVKGVRGLRVIDASVFPNHVSGNIVSSVYAVAEKGADLIKEDCDHATFQGANGVGSKK